MIQGVVNRRCEATLPLVIGNQAGERQVIDAVVDTGFNGFLTLPPKMIAKLCLDWNSFETVTLGDGSETLFDLYAATVLWDGQERKVFVAESETEPLIGMALLYGYRLQIDIIEGGVVRGEALKPTVGS